MRRHAVSRTKFFFIFFYPLLKTLTNVIVWSLSFSYATILILFQDEIFYEEKDYRLELRSDFSSIHFSGFDKALKPTFP